MHEYVRLVKVSGGSGDRVDTRIDRQQRSSRHCLIPHTIQSLSPDPTV